MSNPAYVEPAELVRRLLDQVLEKQVGLLDHLWASYPGPICALLALRMAEKSIRVMLVEQGFERAWIEEVLAGLDALDLRIHRPRSGPAEEPPQ